MTHRQLPLATFAATRYELSSKQGSVWKLPARRGAAYEGEHARRDDEAYL